jgi:hypothetical protein
MLVSAPHHSSASVGSAPSLPQIIIGGSSSTIPQPLRDLLYLYNDLRDRPCTDANDTRVVDMRRHAHDGLVSARRQVADATLVCLFGILVEFLLFHPHEWSASKTEIIFNMNSFANTGQRDE